MNDPPSSTFCRRQQDSLFIVYRRRIIHRGSAPDHPSRCDVICATFWEERQVRELEGKARDLGYELWWEEVPVRSQPLPQQPPDTVFIVFQGGLEQDHPEALELSDPVGLAVYLTRGEVEAVLDSHPDWVWEDVWELPVPWRSPFALNPFPKKHYSGHPADDEFTL